LELLPGKGLQKRYLLHSACASARLLRSCSNVSAARLQLKLGFPGTRPTSARWRELPDHAWNGGPACRNPYYPAWRLSGMASWRLSAITSLSATCRRLLRPATHCGKENRPCRKTSDLKENLLFFKFTIEAYS
jgi:hypothetical protein